MIEEAAMLDEAVYRPGGWVWCLAILAGWAQVLGLIWIWQIIYEAWRDFQWLSF